MKLPPISDANLTSHSSSTISTMSAVHHPLWPALQGIALFSFLALTCINAFSPVPIQNSQSILRSTRTTVATALQQRNRFPHFGPPSFGATQTQIRRSRDTSLNVMLDVPPHFFATSFVMMGLVLDVSKSFGRLRMEERAWEQRLEEARMRRLEEDPTLTELELRRKEAALEWSAYGKPRQEEKELERQLREQEEEERYGEGRRRNRVKVMERDIDDGDDGDDRRIHRMTDDDINAFELEYGVEYDPYYDDPYSEDELPDDLSYKVDKRYGDRIYSNGEIFYKDKESGLFYRQGAKPRSLSFW